MQKSLFLIAILVAGVAGGAPIARAFEAAARTEDQAAERPLMLAKGGKKAKGKKKKAGDAPEPKAEGADGLPPGTEPMSTGSYIAGGIVGTLVGFGIGHAIQGRYFYHGLMFTLVEAASYAALIYSLASLFDPDSPGSSLFLPSLVVFIGFHVWEIVSVWVAPRAPNGQRYKDSGDGAWRLGPAVVRAGERRLGPAIALTYEY